jgi:glycosyltransferase involved in cell wall biosynthesis
MLLSIIITNYNYAAYVEESITSALALVYEPKEVIVVDDGSTDGSREIVDRLAAQHPRIIRIYQENQGMIPAWNAGYLAAKGDLVFALDADDLVEPNMMQEVMARWHTGASKAQFFQRIIMERRSTEWCNRFPKQLTNEIIRRELLRTGSYPWPPTSGNVYSGDFLRIAAPLDPGRRLHDTALNTLAPLYGDVVLVPKVLGSYRMHGRNAIGKSEVDVNVAKQQVIDFLARDRLLLEHAGRLGLKTAAVPRDQDLTNLMKRLTSLKLGRAQHPIPNDRAGRILVKALIALRFSETMRPLSKVAFATWFVLMALGNQALCRRLAKGFSVPPARPRLFVAVMRFFGLAKQPELFTVSET